MKVPPAYVVDTNVWIGLVPFVPALMPDLWRLLGALADEGRIIIPEEVARETHPTHHAGRWVHDRPQLHRPTAPVWDAASAIADRYPDLIKVGIKTSWADPFLIATAISEKQARDVSLWPCDVVVVTNERSHLPRVAIPDACAAEGIPCVDMLGWFAMESWEFTVTAT